MAHHTPVIFDMGMGVMDIVIPSTLTYSRTDRHKLAGVVTVDGIPAAKRVIIFNRHTLERVASTMSHETTGAWEIYGFPEHPERSLFAVALSETELYNAEIADLLTQIKTMPEPEPEQPVE